LLTPLVGFRAAQGRIPIAPIDGSKEFGGIANGIVFAGIQPIAILPSGLKIGRDRFRQTG
jgi:hypothetical protein